jgi:hypothetical protein
MDGRRGRREKWGEGEAEVEAEGGTKGGTKGEVENVYIASTTAQGK